MTATLVAPSTANPTSLVTLLRIIENEDIITYFLVQVTEEAEHSMELYSGWPCNSGTFGVDLAAEHGWVPYGVRGWVRNGQRSELALVAAH